MRSQRKRATGAIRILVGNRQPVVLLGVQAIARSTPHVRVVGTFTSGRDLIDRAKTKRPDVLVISTELSDMNGIDLVRRLKKEGVGAPALLFGRPGSGHPAVEALREGAAGFLSSRAEPAELVRAIETVHQGRHYADSRLAQELASYVAGEIEAGPDVLSMRELRVMCLLAVGMRLGEIATQLSISVSAVNTYRRRLLKKLRLRHNADITRYALKHRLVV